MSVPCTAIALTLGGFAESPKAKPPAAAAAALEHVHPARAADVDASVRAHGQALGAVAGAPLSDRLPAGGEHANVAVSEGHDLIRAADGDVKQRLAEGGQRMAANRASEHVLPFEADRHGGDRLRGRLEPGLSAPGARAARRPPA